MTETQLRAFVAVAETGGFGEAGKRLHMSQPGISRAILALERELGSELLVRNRGSVELTAFGERALVRSRSLLREADAMRRERDELHGIAEGRVRLGSMPSVSAAVLPPLLATLERRHPGLSVTVIEGHDDELVSWVREGIVDISVVAGDHHDLELQPFLTDQLLAVVPATHPLAGHEVLRPGELADEPFILTRAGCERLILAALSAHGISPNVCYEVSEASSILALVAQGLGVSVMPGLAATRATDAVAVRPLAPNAERRLSLAITPTPSPSPAVRAFLATASFVCAATSKHAATDCAVDI